MLLCFIQKFTPRTAVLLKTQPKLCEVFLQLLSISKPLFHGHMTPQEAVLNQVKTITLTVTCSMKAFKRSQHVGLTSFNIVDLSLNNVGLILYLLQVFVARCWFCLPSFDIFGKDRWHSCTMLASFEQALSCSSKCQFTTHIGTLNILQVYFS